MTDRPDPPALPPGAAEDSRAEQVLSQALRVMAGGGKVSVSASSSDGSIRRLATSQLILLSAIIGLLIGIGAGFVSLML